MSRERVTVPAVIGIAFGVGLVLLSELAGLDWLRVFGAVIVTLAALVLGAAVGLSLPPSHPLLTALRRWGKALAVVAAVVISLPILLALLGTLAGLASLGRANPLVALIGIALGLALFACTVLLTLEAVRKILGIDARARGSSESAVEERP